MSLLSRGLWIILLALLQLLWLGLPLCAWLSHAGAAGAAQVAEWLRLLLIGGAGCLAATVMALVLARRQALPGLPPRGALAFAVAAYLAADVTFRMLVPT